MKNNKLKANITYNIFYQLLSIIVPLITAPFVSRKLGVSGMGLYDYCYSIAHYFVLFTMLGILNYGNREIAKVKDSKELCSSTFWNVYSVQLCMGLVCIVIYYCYTILGGQSYRQVMLWQGLYVLSGVLDISWLYFGMEEFKITMVISAITRVISTCLIFLLIKTENDVYLYSILVAGHILVNVIVFWIILPKKILFIRPVKREMSKHLKPILILFIPVISVSLYKYMDKVMLGTMLETSEVGIYSAAERFINVPICVIAAFGTVMLPRISNLTANSEDITVKKYNYISMELIIFLSCGLMFGLAAINDVFIPLFYSNAFNASINVLFILLPSILFVSWANVIRTQNLLPNKKDKEYCISVIVGAVINMVINTLLIPKHGAVGAAVGTTIAECSVCFIQSMMVRKDMPLLSYLKDDVPFLASGGVMFLVIRNISVGSALATVVMRIIGGLVIYLVLSAYFLRRGIKKYENNPI